MEKGKEGIGKRRGGREGRGWRKCSIAVPSPRSDPGCATI